MFVTVASEEGSMKTEPGFTENESNVLRPPGHFGCAFEENLDKKSHDNQDYIVMEA